MLPEWDESGRETVRCVCAEDHSTAHPTAAGMVDVGLTTSDVATVSMSAPFVGVLRFRRARQERGIQARLDAWREAREAKKATALEPALHSLRGDLMNALGERIITSGRMR